MEGSVSHAPLSGSAERMQEQAVAAGQGPAAWPEGLDPTTVPWPADMWPAAEELPSTVPEPAGAAAGVQYPADWFGPGFGP